MNKNLNIQNDYSTKQIRLQLDLKMRIPFNSEVRTFDEVFKNLILDVTYNIRARQARKIRIQFIEIPL